MGIEYLEIRSSETRDIIGILDGAQSIIWHSVYFGCGDFEVYIPASQNNVELLQVGNYVTKPYDDKIAVIEKIEYTNTVTDGKMIVASGRLAKSILDRRIICNLAKEQGKVYYTNYPQLLQGKVEQAACTLVYFHAIDDSIEPQRAIDILKLAPLKHYSEVIVDQNGEPTTKQVMNKVLLNYITSLLEEYGMSCNVVIDNDTLLLNFEVYKGVDRSTDNADNNDPVIFSIEFDNLAEVNYVFDKAGWKNTAIIGGEGEGVERFYSLIEGEETGLNRHELFIDDSSISKTTKENEVEVEYTDEEYNAMLISDGLQKLAALLPLEDFNGTLNVNGGIWRLGEDYNLGDIVTIQDNELGFYVNVRITEITELQDENGYNVEITYSAERTM